MGRIIKLIGGLCLFVAAPQCFAQSAEPVGDPAIQQTESDLYDTLIDTIAQGFDVADMTERALSQMRSTMISSDAELRDMEKSYPGIIEQMLAAMRPIILRHSQRVSTEGRSEMVQLFRLRLTADEAREATEFYRSPLGLRLIESISENISVSATQREAIIAGGEVSAEAISQDHTATVRGSLAALTEQERIQIERNLAGHPWVWKLNLARTEMLEINRRMENAPMSAEDDAALNEVVTNVVMKRIDSKP
jgi:hypothetical protein